MSLKLGFLTYFNNLIIEYLKTKSKLLIVSCSPALFKSPISKSPAASLHKTAAAAKPSEAGQAIISAWSTYSVSIVLLSLAVIIVAGAMGIGSSICVEAGIWVDSFRGAVAAGVLGDGIFTYGFGW